MGDLSFWEIQTSGKIFWGRYCSEIYSCIISSWLPFQNYFLKAFNIILKSFFIEIGMVKAAREVFYEYTQFQ